MFRATLAILVLTVVATPVLAQSTSLASAGVISDRRQHGEGHTDLRRTLDQPARVVIEDLPLHVGLAHLQEKTGVPMAFSPSRLEDAGTVSCLCEDVTVREALDRMLHGTNLRYVNVGTQIIVERAPSIAIPFPPSAPERLARAVFNDVTHRTATRLQPAPRPTHQTGTIAGRVVDISSRRPVAGAQVNIVGTGIGSITNSQGQFTLTNVPAGEVTVRVHFIGYGTNEQAVTVVAGQTAVANVELRQEAVALDAVVVTGQAGQARRREVGNTVGQINVAAVDEPVSNLESLLQGRVSGLNVGEVSAAAGSGSMIRLRGNNSVAMSNQPLVYVDGVRVRSAAYPRNAPLTGPALRSANVFTSPLNDINPNNIERIEVVKGAAATTLYGSEAAGGVIQIFTRKGVTGAPQWTAQIDQGFSHLLPFAGYSRDFPQAGTTEPYMRLDPWLRNGHRQKYFLSARGGTEVVSYNLSGGWDGTEGVLPNDNEEQLSLQANFRLTPVDNVVMDFNSWLTRTDIQQTGSGQNVHSLIVNAYRGDRNNVGGYSKELLDRLLEYDLRTGVTRTFTAATIAHTPRPELSHRLNVGFDRANAENRQVRPFGFILAPLGIMSSDIFIAEMLTVDYAANWNQGITQDFRTTLSAGAQLVNNNTRRVQGYSENFPGPVDPTLGSGSITLSDESRTRVVTGGFFGQVRLEHRDRLFLTGGVRVDGNSAFGERMGLETYPKVSASYVLSDETFWRPQWGTLRLRAAYGQAGRAPGAFDAVRTWDPARRINRPAFVPGNVGNPDLKAERTTEIELGFDASILDDRIVADFTVYRSRTTEALFNVLQVPSMGGWSSQLENVGELENRGIELSLNGEVLRSPSFGWDLGVSVSTNHSELVSLGGAPEFNVGSRARIMEGQPVPVMWGTLVTNPSEYAEPVVETDHLFGPNQPTLIVSPTTRIRFPGNIVLSGRGEFQGGHYVLDAATAAGINRGVPQPTCIEAHALMDADRREELPARYRFLCDFSMYNLSNYVFAADFFKVRDITLTVPVDRVMPWGDNATLALSARNAIRWFNRDWFAYDPEMGGQAGHWSLVRQLSEHAPAPATFVASLRVNF